MASTPGTCVPGLGCNFRPFFTKKFYHPSAFAPRLCPAPAWPPACPGKNLLCTGKLRGRTSNLLEGGYGLNVPDKNLRFISICFPNKGIQICFTSFTKKKTAVLRPIQSRQHPSTKENLRFCAWAGQYTACKGGEQRAEVDGGKVKKAEGDFSEVRRILGAGRTKSRGRFRALNAEI